MDFFSLIITLLVILCAGLPVALIVVFWIIRNKTDQLQQQIDQLRTQVAELKLQPQPATAEPDTAASPEVVSSTEDAEELTDAVDSRQAPAKYQ